MGCYPTEDFVSRDRLASRISGLRVFRVNSCNSCKSVLLRLLCFLCLFRLHEISARHVRQKKFLDFMLKTDAPALRRQGYAGQAVRPYLCVLCVLSRQKIHAVSLFAFLATSRLCVEMKRLTPDRPMNPVYGVDNFMLHMQHKVVRGSGAPCAD